MVVDTVKSTVGWASPLSKGEDKGGDGAAYESAAAVAAGGQDETYDHGVVEAEERNSGEQASMFFVIPNYISHPPTYLPIPYLLIANLILFPPFRYLDPARVGVCNS